MAEEIDFENGRNSNFEGLVTLTLTFDPAIRHIVLQQSSTSIYIPTFIQIEETFCGRTDVRTDVRTDGRTDIFPLYTIRSTFGSRPNKNASAVVYSINPLIVTLKPQSNGPSYSNTAIGSLHWPVMGGLLHLVQRGGDWARPQPTQAHPFSLYQM